MRGERHRLVALVALLALGLAACSGSRHEAASGPEPVNMGLTVDGTGTAAVTVQTNIVGATGAIPGPTVLHKVVTLPWSGEVPTQPPLFATLTAMSQDHGAGAKLSCALSVAGRTVVARTASGPGATVECFGAGA